MKITALYVRAFGNLREFSLSDLPDRLVLVMPNGAGKTTLLEFIFALLYGLGRSAGKQSRRVRYLPWSGDSAGGYLKLFDSRAGRTYRLEGRFGVQAREDRLRLWDLQSGQEVPLGKGESPGAYLTGLPAEVFRSLVMAKEGELKTAAVSDPKRRRNRFLEQLFVGAGGTVSAEQPVLPIEPVDRSDRTKVPEVATGEALRQVEKRKGELRSIRGDKGVIPSLERELLAAERSSYELAGQRAEYQRLLASKRGKEEALKRLRQRAGEMVATAHSQSPEESARPPLAEGSPGGVPAKKGREKTAAGRPRSRSGGPVIFLLLALVIFLSGAYRLFVPAGGLSFLSDAAANYFLLGGLLLGGAAIWRLAVSRRRWTGQGRDSTSFTAEAGEPFDGGEQAELLSLREEIAHLNGQIDSLLKANPDVSKPEDKGPIEQQRLQLGRAYREYRALELAAEALTDLLRTEQVDYFRPFRPSFLERLKSLAMEGIKEAHLQPDFSLQLQIDREGAPAFISDRALSCHEEDLVGLALRLTLAAENRGSEGLALPLILDAPFSGWDDRRRQAAAQVINDLTGPGKSGEQAADSGPAGADRAFSQVICMLASRQEAEALVADLPGWVMFSTESSID